MSSDRKGNFVCGSNDFAGARMQDLCTKGDFVSVGWIAHVLCCKACDKSSIAVATTLICMCCNLSTHVEGSDSDLRMVCVEYSSHAIETVHGEVHTWYDQHHLNGLVAATRGR